MQHSLVEQNQTTPSAADVAGGEHQAGEKKEYVANSDLEPAHPGRRILALVLDFFFFNWLVIGIKSCICLAFPSAIDFFASVSSELFVILLLLFRDSMFGGRGVAKRLLNLRTVDEDTHKPLGLRQSLIRNSILFGTCLVYQLAAITIPDSELFQRSFVINCIGFGSSCFVVVAFTVETILMSIPGGERIGDGLARTITFRDASSCRSIF